ncbi:family 7 glycoside hydrolase [Melampsora larici-populina 98AG31]|uniref:Glucanase n=1 Tax=Melampsora larici-populina (strain 98AG31 / pathotype 3-4-7) TaxID=747676 RepID=F4RKA1_MELLP|nr:family 7 glycoside hydrolase [Melampsora larici-populina 98AG31]EGG07059.1 family 7 glycoside hydrolase [Melampsora larici-populina 98AG31]
MPLSKLSIFTLLASIALSQSSEEVHTTPTEIQPKFNYELCTKKGCFKHKGTVTADVSYREVHSRKDPKKLCLKDKRWDSRLCSNQDECSKNCEIDMISNYTERTGVTNFNKSDNSLSLKLVVSEDKKTKKKNIGSRIYHLDQDGHYVMYKLKGKEISFDVDLSRLGCGLNGAFYLTEMSMDGGSKNQSFMNSNRTGSYYGTGYCDAQCPQDLAFTGAEINLNPPADGAPRKGNCCPEMDILESNALAQAFTPHPCSRTGQSTCMGDQCPEGPKGFCAGCDFNPYRLGSTDFFGPGKTVDSTLPLKIVTQFITDSYGDLAEIKRIYVQEGRIIQNAHPVYPELKPYNSITDNFCSASTALFGGEDRFRQKGGLKKLGQSLDRGMVLVLSLWDDKSDTDMLWLDGTFPPDADPTKPGVVRGPCTPAEGNTTLIENEYPNAFVQYGNIRIGELDSTYP